VNAATARALARSRCRQGLSAVLRALPARLFAPLRRTLPALPPASLRFRMQQAALAVVRHRGVPADIDSFTLADNPGIRLVNADSYVIERLYWFGEKHGYEPEVVGWWREYCRRSNSVLELGANVGYFTVQGAQAAPAARYVAVEPHPACAAACRENARMNHLANVEVIEAAAVAEPAVASVALMTPGGDSRDHYQAPCTGYVGRNEMHPDDTDGTSWSPLAVAAAPFADLLHGADLLKLDVEGQEADLLQSAADQIAVARPTIFVELLDDTPKLRSFITDLCAHTAYRSFVPTQDRLIPLPASEIPSVSLPKAFGTRDLILTCDIVPAWVAGDAMT
jgi:FkbM family methyltransferase